MKPESIIEFMPLSDESIHKSQQPTEDQIKFNTRQRKVSHILVRCNITVDDRLFSLTKAFLKMAVIRLIFYTKSNTVQTSLNLQTESLTRLRKYFLSVFYTDVFSPFLT